MLFITLLIQLNVLVGQPFAADQEVHKRDTLLYYWHDTMYDKYPNLVPEDSYMELVSHGKD